MTRRGVVFIGAPGRDRGPHGLSTMRTKVTASIVQVPPGLTDRRVTERPMRFASRSSTDRLHPRGVDLLEQILGAAVVEAEVEHESPDGPATEAEGVEPGGCVAVERLGIGVRVDGCAPGNGSCRHAPNAPRRDDLPHPRNRAALVLQCAHRCEGKRAAPCGKTLLSDGSRSRRRRRATGRAAPSTRGRSAERRSLAAALRPHHRRRRRQSFRRLIRRRRRRCCG